MKQYTCRFANEGWDGYSGVVMAHDPESAAYKFFAGGAEMEAKRSLPGNAKQVSHVVEVTDDFCQKPDASKTTVFVHVIATREANPKEDFFDYDEYYVAEKGASIGMIVKAPSTEEAAFVFQLNHAASRKKREATIVVRKVGRAREISVTTQEKRRVFLTGYENIDYEEDWK